MIAFRILIHLLILSVGIVFGVIVGMRIAALLYDGEDLEEDLLQDEMLRAAIEDDVLRAAMEDGERRTEVRRWQSGS